MQQQQGNANANSDFTPLQQAVLDVFNNDDKPEGLSVQFVARNVNGATEEQVRCCCSRVLAQACVIIGASKRSATAAAR
eukprot:8437-Heterococcus_DN1.PRE.5